MIGSLAVAGHTLVNRYRHEQVDAEKYRNVYPAIVQPAYEKQCDIGGQRSRQARNESDQDSGPFFN